METPRYTHADALYCLKMAEGYAGGNREDIPHHREAVAWWNVYCLIAGHLQPDREFHKETYSGKVKCPLKGKYDLCKGCGAGNWHAPEYCEPCPAENEICCEPK